MNCMQVSIGPGVRIDRSCPSARRAAGAGWLGGLVLLVLLVLGWWGAQPGSVRPGVVAALPPLSTVELRQSAVTGAFKIMDSEDEGEDGDGAPTETQRDEAAEEAVASASALQYELDVALLQHTQHVEANAEAARTFDIASAKLVDVSNASQGKHQQLASCEASCKASTDWAKSLLFAETERALASKTEELRVEYALAYERGLRRIDEDDEVRKRSFCPFLIQQ
jgi:hypothetical protein